MRPALTSHQCCRLMPFILRGHGEEAGEVCIAVPTVRVVLGVSPEIIQKMPFYLRPCAVEEGGLARAGYVLDEKKLTEFAKQSKIGSREI